MIRTIIAAIALASPAAAQIEVIDGDTVRGSPANLRLTLRNRAPYDTPETWRPECRAEAVLGAIATARLRGMIASADRSTVHVLPGTCGYGRGCAWIEVDGVDAGAALIFEGLAAPSPNFDWCGSK